MFINISRLLTLFLYASTRTFGVLLRFPIVELDRPDEFHSTIPHAGAGKPKPLCDDCEEGPVLTSPPATAKRGDKVWTLLINWAKFFLLHIHPLLSAHMEHVMQRVIAGGGWYRDSAPSLYIETQIVQKGLPGQVFFSAEVPRQGK